MKKATATIFILLSILFKCDAQNGISTNQDVLKEQIKLRNYAFCSCLYLSYPNDSILTKDGSGAGYFELSAYDVDVFPEIDSLAKIFIDKKYLSKHKRPLAIMKCLDFYNSKELASLISKLDGQLDLKKNKSK